MTTALTGLLGLAALVAEYLWLRPAARTRLHQALIVPLQRRARCARRSLAAIGRVLTGRVYHPAHAPAHDRKAHR